MASYGLGLDQGVASIGWAILKLNRAGEAIGIERLGAHCFESGTEGDIESGRDESRAGPRRLAWQLRKQYRRRVLRKRRLLRWLQELGLMPAGDISTSQGRDTLLKRLDNQLRSTWEPGETTDHRTRQLLPYRIRAAGLTRKLEAFEIGRALYHLAQRRGYLSNRKTQGASKDPCDEKKRTRARKGNAGPPPKGSASDSPQIRPGQDEAGNGKEDAGVVRAAIIELQRQMEAAGCKTLADYFSKLDPAGTLGDRLRGRWTAREMFLEEFGRLMAEQAKHHSTLTDDVRRKLHRAIFFQRPLQSMSHLIGTCDLVKGEKRLALGHRMAQRFRILQKVNDLKILRPDFTTQDLTKEERNRLIAALDRRSHINFTELKTKARFGLPRGSSFNLEEGGETTLIGNRTEAKCRCIFGDDRWDAMSEADKDAVVHDLLLFEKPSALKKRGEQAWKLSPDKAAALGDCVLEPGFAAHSKAAFAKLLPRMEEGTPYATARKEEFQGIDTEAKMHDLLPPVEGEDGLGQLRNPTVTRALTELRKLVNAVVRRYGKPAWIRLELARDLKRARKQRERMSKDMRAREKERNDARDAVEATPGGNRNSRTDVERVLLAEECNWVCPYTGKSFGMAHVVGRHPQVDIEHIWPLSRSLDDSFLNKTLCYTEENRVKGNRTPFEAYGQSGERWDQILQRVKSFKGDAARVKYERFVAPEIPEDKQPARHLSETRKIGAASAEYLGLLYGGAAPVGQPQRVFVTSGGLTAHLRREWHLNGLLSVNGEKSRDDHRHHAIDALVIALTDARAVQVLQKAAEEASSLGRRLFSPVEEPWKDFVNEARGKVEAINVSYRQNRKYAGKLHAETHYSRSITLPLATITNAPTPSKATPDKQASAAHERMTGERRVRKVLAKLTEKEVARIVDPRVRKAVDDQIKKLGLVGKGPAKQYTDFVDVKLHPYTPTKAGGKNWIHKVRITTGEKPWAVGNGPRERFVTSTKGSNHHSVVAKGPDGKWTDKVVPLIALKAPTAGSPVPRRPHGGDSFTLAAGEFVLMTDKEGRERLMRVTKLSDRDIGMISHTEARTMDEVKKSNDLVRRSGSTMMRDGAKKVTVTYLGEIRRAGG
ncbi:MAG: type II CRISPR RNA-guided endonuclease Cas9 [Phycisphaerales bacterium]|nr:type II CRISPR RNA-guided endonuclease Cas9 [Phycisphaerales bacterium]